jgi:dTDP-4-amino-4,6-dideoxygalactose transaminase
MNPAKIPLLDLVTLHQELKEELTGVFARALDTAGFIGGPMVDEFERGFADYCETAHCVGVGSGTDALRFALMASGVGEGDVVLTAPNTFIATSEAITQAGARPEFIDIDERTYNMDPEKLARYVESACDFDATAGALVCRRLGLPVRAIVPVHLYGQPADMDPILDLAERYGLVVIEDACQAHGAEYFSRRDNCWKKVGSMGRAAAFSFYPGKNLGACGEAGAVTTNDAGLAQSVRMLRDHGQARKYYHELEGYNGRLDAIQAGFLKVKLEHLAEWNQARREAAARYNELLSVAGQQNIAPFEAPYSKAVYHLYVIRVPDRDRLQKALAQNGVGTGIHYPIALHLQKAYEHLGYRLGDFPVAENAAEDILSLPMFPQLGRDEQEYVVKQVLQFHSEPEPTGSDKHLAVTTT